MNAPFSREQSRSPDSDGNHHVGAEFLRLNERSGGQRLAAYSGGKAEVVFDPRARPGLPAVSAGVENRDRQAFGTGVDSGREPSWPGADHRDVIDEVHPRGDRQSDLARQDLLRWIAEHCPVWADHQGQSAGDVGISADHILGFEIPRRIEQMVGITVPGEKAIEPDHVGRAR